MVTSEEFDAWLLSLNLMPTGSGQLTIGLSFNKTSGRSSSSTSGASGEWGGFASVGKLLDHFVRHAAKLGHLTIRQYVQGADDLFNASDVESFQRLNGETEYYRASTNEFGIRTAGGTTLTYYAPEEGILYWLAEKARYKP